MSGLHYHLFICGHKRSFGHPRGSCNVVGKGSVLMAAFASALAQRNLLNKVAINSSDCFGLCDGGPNVVVYPGSVMYCHLTEDDVERIVEQHFVHGQIFDEKLASRLVWQGGI